MPAASFFFAGLTCACVLDALVSNKVGWAIIFGVHALAFLAIAVAASNSRSEGR